MPPKVIFTNSFLYQWKVGEEDLLSYYARPAAFTNKAADEQGDSNYDLLTYMGNAEKSDGCFNDKTDLFTEKDIDEHRRLEIQSMANGCPKYVSVISFDNDFLKENNLLINGVANVAALKQITRKAVSALVKEEKKFDEDNVYWCGAIHTNTDNIHIHLSILEKERREDRIKKYRDGDLISVRAMDKLKSSVVNSIIKDNPKVKELQHIERELLLPKLKESFTNTTAQMYDLAGKLPQEKGWQYNRPKMKKYQPEINKVVDNIINSNDQLRNLYGNYNQSIDNLCSYYKDIYGAGHTNKFAQYKQTKLKEFRERSGNALLNELSKLDTNVNNYINEQHELKSENSFLSKIEDENEYIAEQEQDRQESENIVEDIAGIEDSGIIYKMDWNADYKRALGYLYGNKKLKIQKDVDKAVDLLAMQARKGNVLAMCDLGKVYEKGLGKNIETDEDKAYKYYAKAFKGFGKILNDRNIREKTADYINYRIGKMHAYGNGVEQSDQKSVEHFMLAESNKYAQYSLGNAFKFGKGVERDDKRAFQYYLRSAASGNAYADYAVASYYDNGNITFDDMTAEQISDKCAEHYRKALDGFVKMYEDSEDDNLAYKIGVMCLRGKGVSQDTSAAEEWFEVSAAPKNELATYQLAKLYIDSDTAPEGKYEQRLAKGLEMLSQLSQKNDNAAYILGKYYYEHNDIDRAEQYFLRCADRNETACYKLGKIYMSDTKKDIDKAIKYLTKASEEYNNQFACYQLGKIYLSEEKNDRALAEHWLSKACDLGNEWACYKLGGIYLSEEKKIELGEKLLLRACEKNNHWACFKLGQHYCKTGRRDEGLSLLAKAHDLGNEYAGYAIERILHPKVKVRKKHIVRPKSHRNYHLRAAMYALNRLYNEYEQHVKELQAEFERDEENREFENEYYIEYSRDY